MLVRGMTMVRVRVRVRRKLLGEEEQRLKEEVTATRNRAPRSSQPKGSWKVHGRYLGRLSLKG